MTFTIEEVLLILQNVGIDIECPACVETAFCENSTVEHDCEDEYSFDGD